jgi:hypothetical protein
VPEQALLEVNIRMRMRMLAHQNGS